jgi:hypothetical protein
LAQADSYIKKKNLTVVEVVNNLAATSSSNSLADMQEASMGESRSPFSDAHTNWKMKETFFLIGRYRYCYRCCLTYIINKERGGCTVEVAPKSALVPPPFPLQLIKRPLFEDSELRGLGGGIGGRKNGEKGCEDS